MKCVALLLYDLYFPLRTYYFSGYNIPAFYYYPIGKFYTGPFSNGIAVGIHQAVLGDGTQAEVCTSSDFPGSWNYIFCEEDDFVNNEATEATRITEATTKPTIDDEEQFTTEAETAQTVK